MAVAIPLHQQVPQLQFLSVEESKEMDYKRPFTSIPMWGILPFCSKRKI